MKETHPPPYIVSYVNEDIDEFCGSGHFNLDIKQLSCGAFNGRTTVIRLPDCTLTRRTAGARHALTGWVPQAATMLFPLGRQEAFVCGRLRGLRQQCGSLGNHEVYSVVPENFGHLLVSVPIEALARHLGPSECSLFVETLATIEDGLVDAQLKSATTARLLDIFCGIEQARPPLAQHVLVEYCRQVVHLLFGYLAVHAGRDPARTSNHEKILHRTLNLIASRPERAFSIDEMAREVFASKRAVQYAFVSLLGLSPIRFQKLYRLNLVRKDLRVARSPLKVAGIVSKYGFSNAGRMSREYADLFGERPADTLRQVLVPDPAAAHDS